MSKPRAADDFAMIRTRMEELRRERARAFKKDGGPEDAGPGARGFPKGTEGRQRPEPERSPAVSSSRRYGSGR